MVLILLVAMIGVPILEIIVFIEAGGYIGLWPTIGAVILTAIIGSFLLRQQGLSTLARAQENLSAGRLPVAEVFDGLCILVGGALLLTPGFITDAVGFMLLVPPVRGILRRWSGDYLAKKAEIHTWTETPPTDDGPRPPGDGPVIDGQFEEVDPRNDDPFVRPAGPADPTDPTDPTKPAKSGKSPGWGRRGAPPRVVRPDDP